MIVADANALAYLLIPQSLTTKAEGVRSKEKIWVVPPVLPHEWLSVVMRYVRGGQLDVDEAARIFRRGMAMVEVSVIPPDAGAIFGLSEASGCSTYDCEYVWLARELDLNLLTEDQEVARVSRRGGEFGFLRVRSCQNSSPPTSPGTAARLPVTTGIGC